MSELYKNGNKESFHIVLSHNKLDINRYMDCLDTFLIYCF